MKEGLSLVELAEELERQRHAKRDFLADTRSLTVEPDDSSPTKIALRMGDNPEVAEHFPVQHHAVRQMGERLKIPAKFVDRLAQSHPDMLAWNLNELFHREPEKRMLRTMDGNVRGFLSKQYRPLDNFELATSALPKLQQLGASIESCQITDTRMYIKGIVPGIQREVKADGHFFGDGGHHTIHVLKPGITISNSEIGLGSLAIQPGIWERWCSNLAMMAKNAMRKYHVGRSQATDEKFFELFQDSTKKTMDAAFWAQVSDLISAALEGELFEQMVDQARERMFGAKLEKPQEAVRELKNLTEAEQDNVLTHLIRGGDLSQFGMQSAITLVAQDENLSYDRATELEAEGGRILELAPRDWETIARAA